MQAHLISVALVLAVVLPSTRSDETYCEEPPDIQFATLEEPSEQYAVGDAITYTCQFGYASRGKSSTLECKFSKSGKTAEWTQARFSCTPQSCGDPGYINNGRRIGSLFAFPNFVKYECNEGYRLKGLSTRYCQASGSWSGKLPSCEEITCSAPQKIENGFVTYSSLDYGSELTYKCDKGFSLNTDEPVFCESDGKWSNADVECIESVCDMPEKPEYGSLQITSSSGNPLAGTLALFTCDENRIMDGPATSKCLETGRWTFPPPKCLEPCKVPYISNGVIGNYVKQRYSRRRDFKEVTVGYKVEEDDTLYLRCSHGYEISGTEKKEESVSCKRGKWSLELHCEPAPCRSGPPSVQNAQPVALNPEHGGMILYLCDDDFKKTVNETIICDFGTWKGSPPVCKNTKCYVDDLKFPGLITGRKSTYRDGEEFEVECDSRYRIANANRRDIRCEVGSWKGVFPPCVAASCAKPPPEINHGQAQAHSTFHSSFVDYTCQQPYVLIKNSRLQCLFGEWNGELPKCEDGRCYLKDLKNSMYVDSDVTESVTLSGNKLNVICKEGYSAKGVLPNCLNGQWRENSYTPCKENDCAVPLLYHGDIKETRTGDWYWSWSNFRYEKKISYVKIIAGTVLPYGTSKILFCNSPYYFQGTSLNRQDITCFKGKWQPDPVCLLRGQKYVPPTTTTRKPYTTTPSKVTEQRKVQTTSTKIPQISAITTHEDRVQETIEPTTPPAEKILPTESEIPEAKCYCVYPINDENLIAHADGKRLKYHDKVNNGSLVVFRCKHVGFHKLDGVQNIKCEDCQNWHSSEFPACSEPLPGSAVIIHDNTLNVSIEGNLEAMRGQDVKFRCVAVESSLYPIWTVPSEVRVTVKRERMERESHGDVLYIADLAIEKADLENEGSYGCTVNESMNIINLEINDPNLRCPEFMEVDGVSVAYDMERRVKSKALFSCTKANQEIIGETVLTCQRNGQWSGDFLQCTDIKCQELQGNDLLHISYTNDRKIGSKATFHCFLPGQRSGASYADCLQNGTWSSPTPICRTPPCVVKDILPALPDNVVPAVDNKTVQYNETLKLTCAEDMVIEGEPSAKCNKKGEWIIGNIQCVSGCPALSNDSGLIITPLKRIYELYEMVTFSCPPGMTLTTDSQLIMCLKSGWSDAMLPDCQ